MAGSVEVRPFDRSHREYVSRFVTECTGNAMDPAWVTEVLTTVVTDARAVCELWRGEHLVGVGVAIDGLDTEGNAGELSVFTQPPADPEATAMILEWGESRVRQAGRSRVDVPRWPGVQFPEPVLSARGYRIGHMVRGLTRLGELGAHPVVLEVAATNAAGLALYRWFGFEVTGEIPVYSVGL